MNEAMSFRLPVITTEKCVAGMELIKNGVNGYVIPVEDYELLTRKIMQIGNDRDLHNNMSHSALETIRKYTIQNMALIHKKILEESARYEKNRNNGRTIYLSKRI